MIIYYDQSPSIICTSSTRRQRKKEYLGNIFFGTAPTDMDSRGLIQMEQLQQGTDELVQEYLWSYVHCVHDDVCM